MESNKVNIKQSIWSGGRWTVLLTLLFLILSWKANVIGDLIIALPYFVLLYFIFFTIGRNEVAGWLRNRMDDNFRKVVIFPAVLIVLYYSYILINGENPFQGTVFLLPYLIFFPTLVFYANREQSQQFTWVDFTTFFLFLLPTTLVDFKPSGNLPFHGGGFDSVYRIVIMLAAIYAFVVVRQLNDVGAYPVFKWKYLVTALWVWLAFYLFVLGVGHITNFLRIEGHNIIDLDLGGKNNPGNDGHIPAYRIVRRTFLQGTVAEFTVKKDRSRRSLENLLDLGTGRSSGQFVDCGICADRPISLVPRFDHHFGLSGRFWDRTHQHRSKGHLHCPGHDQCFLRIGTLPRRFYHLYGLGGCGRMGLRICLH